MLLVRKLKEFRNLNFKCNVSGCSNPATFRGTYKTQLHSNGQIISGEQEYQYCTAHIPKNQEGSLWKEIREEMSTLSKTI